MSTAICMMLKCWLSVGILFPWPLLELNLHALNVVPVNGTNYLFYSNSCQVYCHLCFIYFDCYSCKGVLYIHYSDVIMGPMASQITSLAIVYSTVYSDADQRKLQSSASLAFARSPVNSPHKWQVTRNMFPFDDAIMCKSRAGVTIFESYVKLLVWNFILHNCVLHYIFSVE